MVIVMIDRLIALISLAAGIFAVLDSRRQRNRREKAVIAAREVIQRAYGSLIHLKGAVAAFGSSHTDPKPQEAIILAIDDTLEAINQQRDSIQSL
jgi:hypothetical protein